MSDAQTVAHENNMAACGFGTDLSADFDRIFVIFALEMHFQRFFFLFLFCFLVTPINQFLIILGRCTLYTPVCLQDEPTCMRIEPV